MKLLRQLLVVCGLLVMAGSSAAQEQPAPALVQMFSVQPEQVTLSLRLRDDHQFGAAVLEALKSGQMLDLRYKVTLMVPRWLWSGRLAERKVFRKAWYEHRTDEFLLMEKEINQYLGGADSFEEALLTLPDIVVPLATPLPDGQGVMVRVTARFTPSKKEEGSLMDWLSLKRFWQEREFTQEALIHVGN